MANEAQSNGYYLRQNVKQRRSVVAWLGDTKPALFAGRFFAGVRSKTAITGIEARKLNALGVLQLRVAGVNVGVIAIGPGFTALGNVAANALVELDATTGFTGVQYVELRDSRANPMGRGVLNCSN